MASIATLAPDCVYEIVPTGQRWEGHDGARAFYTELFGAFPDNAFALSEIVIGPQGAFEVATLTGTNTGPWAGVAPSGLAVSLEVLILFPWDQRRRAVRRRADLVRPGDPAVRVTDVRLHRSRGATIITSGRQPIGHSPGYSP